MSLKAENEHRVSRKLTVNVNQHSVNIRPIIKGAFNEAASTLTEAYLTNSIMGWCVKGLDKSKHEEFLYTLFRQMINTASIQSRDFALQVEGCKGVLTWTNNTSTPSWPRVLSSAKLARLIGWTAALRAVTKVAPSCEKTKRKIMSAFPQFITITYIGVLPHEQHKGYGTALMNYVLSKADESKHPAYVEATDPQSVKFFEQFGFKVRATVYIGNHEDLPVALMVRLPTVSGAPERLRIRPGRRDSDDSL